MPYSVVAAGTTERTLQSIKALWDDPRFHLEAILTPAPKPIGRDQELTPNPVHEWANSNQLPILLIENKIDEQVKKEVESLKQPDFLLVVDFGYIVPQWLLDWPQIMPVNIHPSALPKWRGSSPGQMVLLHGETESAVTVMQMNASLDEGPILYQQEFAVENDWTQADYYQHSFNLISPQLPDILEKVATGEIKPTPQPVDSPTPVADRLTKDEAFFSWEDMQNPEKAVEIERAVRAFNPWPLVWTKIQTNKGEKRMQVLEARLENGELELKTVKIEGMDVKSWSEVKNVVRS